MQSTSEDFRGELVNLLQNSRLNDIIEYGRVVHAEMEAILACSRSGTGSKGATLYSTTFPCHNCAKHIIAAGIRKVVFVEPYPNSKAVEFHSDSTSFRFNGATDTVLFEPFVSVGPRHFVDLFSMNLGAGYPLSRKDQEDHIIDWYPEKARLRM
jgi:deoxycytidylate deaminase